jgi:hypothetical protein
MIWKLIRYILLNAVLPTIVPALTFAIAAWFINGSFPFWDSFWKLWYDGFYIFSVLALVFSLYDERNNVLKAAIGIWFQSFVVVLALFTLIFFYKSYGNESFVSEHLWQSYSIWVLTVIVTTLTKYKILKYKNELGIS